MAFKNQDFYDCLNKNGVEFYAGVPDSLLKDFGTLLFNQHPVEKHVIAANEGCAVGLAMGYHLATGTIPCVYLQNSGLGNLINPLLSLVDPKVYSIPLVLVIGWRGEVNPDGSLFVDEPQHVKQGMVTLNLLDAMNVDYLVLDENLPDFDHSVSELIQKAKEQAKPVAIVVRKNSFLKEDFKVENISDFNPSLNREEVMAAFLHHLSKDDLIVATTGKTSRELFELRAKKGIKGQDFYTVGGMGHASQIAGGLAIGNPGKRIFCFDGDGALIMHLGGSSNLSRLDNFVHVVFNNGSHESVGGHPTQALTIDLCAIAKAMGYETVKKINTTVELQNLLHYIAKKNEGSCFIEIMVKAVSRKNLGRPDLTPIELKTMFIQQLGHK